MNNKKKNLDLRLYPAVDMWLVAEKLIQKIESKPLNSTELDLLNHEWTKIKWSLRKLYPHEPERLDNLSLCWRQANKRHIPHIMSIDWNMEVPRIDAPQWQFK